MNWSWIAISAAGVFLLLSVFLLTYWQKKKDHIESTIFGGKWTFLSIQYILLVPTPNSVLWIDQFERHSPTKWKQLPCDHRTLWSGEMQGFTLILNIVSDWLKQSFANTIDFVSSCWYIIFGCGICEIVDYACHSISLLHPSKCNPQYQWYTLPSWMVLHNQTAYLFIPFGKWKESSTTNALVLFCSPDHSVWSVDDDQNKRPCSFEWPQKGL